jgi:hypothetical protein
LSGGVDKNIVPRPYLELEGNYQKRGAVWGAQGATGKYFRAKSRQIIERQNAIGYNKP